MAIKMNTKQKIIILSVVMSLAVVGSYWIVQNDEPPLQKKSWTDLEPGECMSYTYPYTYENGTKSGMWWQFCMANATIPENTTISDD